MCLSIFLMCRSIFFPPLSASHKSALESLLPNSPLSSRSHSPWLCAQGRLAPSTTENAPGETLIQHYGTHAQEELAAIYAQQHAKTDAQQLAKSPNISAFAPAHPMAVNAYPELW